MNPHPADPLSLLPRGLAAIDLGTNSFRLVARGLQRIEYPRIGRGVDSTSRLSPAAIRAGLSALGKFSREIRRRRLRVVGVVGTSAFRDASNAAPFCDAVHRRFGWTIEILSGEEEAGLTFFGAVASLKVLPLPSARPYLLVSDVGGGSTELIWGTSHGPRMIGRVSLNLGSVRMTERYGTAGRASPSKLSRLARDVRRMFDRSGVPWKKIGAVVGVGGTATTLAAILYGVEPYDEKRVHGVSVPLDSMQKMLEVLSVQTPRERMMLPAVPRGRADIIVAGTVIQTEIVRAACAPGLIASDAGILTGLILSRR